MPFVYSDDPRCRCGNPATKLMWEHRDYWMHEKHWSENRQEYLCDDCEMLPEQDDA